MQGQELSSACCAVQLPEADTVRLQVSYMILQRVSPVTHSIGNCLKRVIVIVASVVIFQNPMSQKNILGAHCSEVPRFPCLSKVMLETHSKHSFPARKVPPWGLRQPCDFCS